MIVRLNAYRAICDACKAESQVYHAAQNGALPLPPGWVRRPGTGTTNYTTASSERILCPYCAMKREDAK